MTDDRKHVAVLLDAGHDRSGNPRRVYVLIDQYGVIVATVDDGYSGWQAVSEAGFPNAVPGPSFPTTPGEYRYLTHPDRPHRAGESDKRWAVTA